MIKTDEYNVYNGARGFLDSGIKYFKGGIKKLLGGWGDFLNNEGNYTEEQFLNKCIKSLILFFHSETPNIKVTILYMTTQ